MDGLYQATDSSHLFPSVPAFMTVKMTFMAKMMWEDEKSKMYCG